MGIEFKKFPKIAKKSLVAISPLLTWKTFYVPPIFIGGQGHIASPLSIRPITRAAMFTKFGKRLHKFQ